MQLSLTTDYAIRILACIGASDGVIPSTEISEKVGISQAYVMKVIRKLSKAGMVKTHQGPTGGVSLGRDPKYITLYDVINLMEATTRINRCLEEDCFCSNNNTAHCKVRKFYTQLQKNVDESLRSVTLDFLINS